VGTWVHDGGPGDRHRRRLTAVRAVGALFGLIAGAVVAVVLVFVGPRHEIVCGNGHRLDDAAEGVFSERIDGPTATFCVVPSELTWVAAAGVLVAGVILGAVLISRALIPEEDRPPPERR
jgi:hypothetical protein